MLTIRPKRCRIIGVTTARQPWNTESTSIKPGATDTVTVIFGYQYGHKPGFKLDPSKVENIKVFANGKSADTRTFRIVSLVAGGESGEAPGRLGLTKSYLCGRCLECVSNAIEFAGGKPPTQTGVEGA